MEKDKKYVLQVGFTLIIIILLLIKKCNKVNTYIDSLFILIGLISSFIILFSTNNSLLDLAHFLYCGVYIIGVSLLSKNECMLFLNSLMIIYIITSRFYYKKCLLNEKQKNKGQFRDINKKLKLDWNIIYPCMFFISFLKI